MFISRRLNNKNQRFGFVKFQDVVDVVDLERRLDFVGIGYYHMLLLWRKVVRGKKGIRTQ